MKNRIKLISLALCGAFVAPAFAASSAEIEEMQAEIRKMQVKIEALEDGKEDSGFGGLVVSGMMDPAFIYNKRRNSTGVNFLSNLDFRDDNEIYAYDNSYFGQVLLQIDKEMESGTKWKLALVPHKSTSSGFNLGSIVHEATVSIPLTDLQTRLIAGQMPDWSGYEYYFGHQTKLITHNLLFDFTIPSFYQGAGLELTRGKWLIKTMAANMNRVSSAEGQEGQNPVLTYRVDYSKGEYDGFGFAGQHGKIAGKKIDMFELDGYFIRGDWSLYGQVGAGQWKENASAIDANTGLNKDAEWWGLSAYAGYKLTPRLELVARADYINNAKNGGGTIGTVFGCVDGATGGGTGAVAACDAAGAIAAGDYRNGFGPSSADALALESGAITADELKGANRSALSLGAHYAVNSNTALKVELRLDQSSKPTFLDVKTGNFEKTNTLFGTSVVVSF
jgi:Protein of unknown function (DUF3138)